MNAKGVALGTDEQVAVLQQYGAGLISRRTAIEALGLVVDVDEELRRLGVPEEEN